MSGLLCAGANILDGNENQLQYLLHVKGTKIVRAEAGK